MNRRTDGQIAQLKNITPSQTMSGGKAQLGVQYNRCTTEEANQPLAITITSCYSNRNNHNRSTVSCHRIWEPEDFLTCLTEGDGRLHFCQRLYVGRHIGIHVCERLPGANSSPTVTKLGQSYPWPQGTRWLNFERSRSVDEVCTLLKALLAEAVLLLHAFANGN